VSPLWLVWLLVFFARVADMSLATVRTLFLVRGRSWQAGSIGFVEAFLYIIALNMVFRHLDNIWGFLFYAAGFACGNILGAFVEEKLAVGYLAVQVIPKRDPDLLTEKLRNAGFGVTVWEGEGREGRHQVLNIVLNRKDRDRLFSLVNDYDQSAFISVSEARARQGGVFGRRKAK